MNRLSLFPLIVGLLPIAANGDIPLQVNHQGVVKVNGVPFDDSGDFRFAIVDPDTNPPDGANLWTNDGSELGTSNMPTAAVSVAVANGVYSVLLGDASLPNMTSIPSSVFNDDNVVLRIWFDDTQGNGAQKLTPDHVLSSSPYAYRVFDGVTLSENQTLSGDKTFSGTTSFAQIVQLLSDSQEGDIFFHGATELVRLPPGQVGQFLQTQGPNAPPTWADASSSGPAAASSKNTSPIALSGSFQDIATVEITVETGQKVFVVGFVSINNNSSGGGNGHNSMRLVRNGTDLGVRGEITYNNGFHFHDGTGGCTVVDDPGQGTHTYRVQALSSPGTTTVGTGYGSISVIVVN